MRMFSAGFFKHMIKKCATDLPLQDCAPRKFVKLLISRAISRHKKIIIKIFFSKLCLHSE
jgi:hypothetical protein